MPTPDYDALAKQFGATSSTPASSAAPVDYDALAKQNGAISSTALTHQDRGILAKAWDVLTDPAKRQEFMQQLEPQAGDDAGTKGAKAAARVLTGAVTMPYDLLKSPQTPEENAAYASGSATAGPVGGTLAVALKRGVADPAVDQGKKAVADYNTPGVLPKVSAAGHAVAAALPVLGPMAADIGERLPTDPIGATVQGTALALTPEYTKTAVAAAAPVLSPVLSATARAADTVATKVSPRGMFAGKMAEPVAEVPNAQPITRGELVQTARDHGINLDLADATDNPIVNGVRKSNSVSLGSQDVIAKNAKANNAALQQWGEDILNKASESPLDREQVGKVVQEQLQKQQAAQYDQAGQYFEQVDKTVGSAKPDVTDVRKIAKQIVDDNKGYYAKHPELRPGQAWKTVQTLASDGSTTPDGLTWKEFVQAKMPAAMKAAATKADAMDLLKKQFRDLGGDPDAKPVTYTWSDLQKLRSDMMKAVESPDIVGSRSEGWLKHLEGAISEVMDQSAGKLSPMDQELYQKANGIWQAMKGTYDNPQHPFYHIVRAMDGTTAGNMAANLKPEFVRQLEGAMGDKFSAYQRDQLGRILNPKNSAEGFDFKNLNTRMNRADVERLATVLSPDQMRELLSMGKVASRVTADVNPSGTAKVGVPAAEISGLVNPHSTIPTAAELALQRASAKAITSPKVIDFLTMPAKDAAKANAASFFKKRP